MVVTLRSTVRVRRVVRGADTTLIYRRTRDEMPAEDYEIVEAEHEGREVPFLNESGGKHRG